MKRIYINGRFLSQHTTGVQRVGIETLKELNKSQYSKYIRVLIPEKKSKEFQNLFPNIGFKVINSPFELNGHLWEQIILATYVKRNKGVLINFCNTAPILLKQQIVYIHDAAIYDVPEGYTKKFIWWYKLLYLFLRRGNEIVTVSDFSKKRIVEKLKVEEESITKIYNGIDHLKVNNDLSVNTTVMEKFRLSEKDFYLTVGSQNPNKNQILIENLAKLNPSKKFVIVGRESKAFKKVDNEVLPNCIYTGYLDDNDLELLYKKAKCFIFPSLYEGFGIPPFEALIQGTPVLVSDRGSMKELLNEYTVMFNPSNINEINFLINSQNIQNELLEKVNKFSNEELKLTWENSAKMLEKLITKLGRKTN